MRLLAKPILRTGLTVFPLVMMLFFISSGTASASVQRPTSACQWYWYTTGTLDYSIWAGHYSGSYCPGVRNAVAETWLINCTGGWHDAETDTWQTRWINPQGTRYDETGRSGWVTYPNDCNYYWTQNSWFNEGGQLQNPSWGCVWLAADDNPYNALDYQCGQFPNYP